MTKLHSYSKVWQLGHRETDELLKGPVVVQEKVDGSQFSFGCLNGELHCRSKGVAIGPGGNQEGMFDKAVKTADLIFRTGTVPEGMTIRTEYLQSPHHNSLTYNRVPTGHLLVFDIELAGARLLPPIEVREMASKWSLETVPTFFEGELSAQALRKLIDELMERESFLGGCKIEGVVVKNYARYDSFFKPLMAKFVSEKFKELNTENWKAQSHGSMIDRIIAGVNKEAVWEKAIQHARDDGVLLNAPQDIGLLIGLGKRDFGLENGERIKKVIFKEYYPDIERGIMRGFPEWYKARLLERVKDG